MEEKYKIQQALVEGKTVEDIAEAFSRSKTAIENYKKQFTDLAAKFAAGTEAVTKTAETLNEVLEEVEDEVDDVVEDQVEALNDRIQELEAQLAGKVQETVENNIELTEEAVVGTLHKLRQSGVDKNDAKLALNQVRSKLKEKIDDPSRLAALCMRELDVLNSMIREGASGRDGVAVMTKAAAEIIEEKQKNYSTRRSQRNCLFNPKTGEVT